MALGPFPTLHVIYFFFFLSAELKLIVCDKNEKVKNLLSRFKETPNLETLVVMETITKENKALAQQLNVKLLQYSELEVSQMLCVKFSADNIEVFFLFFPENKI